MKKNPTQKTLSLTCLSKTEIVRDAEGRRSEHVSLITSITEALTPVCVTFARLCVLPCTRGPTERAALDYHAQGELKGGMAHQPRWRSQMRKAEAEQAALMMPQTQLPAQAGAGSLHPSGFRSRRLRFV